jgi:hypothetical protein
MTRRPAPRKNGVEEAADKKKRREGRLGKR